MTLEPTVTIERPLPTTTPAAEPVSRQTTNTGVSMPGVSVTPELVRSSFGGNPAAAPSLGAVSGDPRHHRVIPAATPYSPSPLVRAVAPESYSEASTASHGIRQLAGKLPLAGAVVFEPTSGDTFTTKHIVAKHSDRAAAWSGMQISTRDFGDLWGRLQKYGFAEFSTLGVAGQGNFDRTAFRVAFQLRNTEWVTLVRTRQPNGDEAIVALVTESSVQAHLPSFHSATVPQNAARKAA